MKTSTCCEETAIESGDKHFCGGVDGCGKWCEWTEPKESKSTPMDWRIEFDKKFNKITELNRGDFVISDVSGSRFQAHTDDNGKVLSFGTFDSIKDFISQVETQAYKQGQADAYRESAEVVRNSVVEAYKNPYPTKLNISERDLQFTADGHNQACRQIVEAIEQLSSNQ